MSCLFFAAIVALAPAAPVAGAPTPVKALVHHTVSTSDPQAQEYFDEGLTLVYAFNREEARKRFEEAAKADPKLAMAEWGIALAVGPNVNVSMSASDLAVAVPALQKAKALESGASDEERGYIAALAVRYPAKIDDDASPGSAKYRDSMAKLHAGNPNDPDAATLYGESIMDADEWGWQDGKPTGSEQKLLDTLHAALAVDPKNVGANHYLVHALDASPAIAAGAVASARLLAALPAEPAASHLVHMSGHTFLDVGSFVELERANTLAVRDDEAYAASVGKKPMDLDYYSHNLDFYGGSGLMLDDLAVADDSAARFAEVKNTHALLIYARERRWDAIAAWPAPDPKRVSANLLYRYARTLAALARGDDAGVTSERASLGSVIAKMDAYRSLAPISTLLDARIAFAHGDRDKAYSSMHAYIKAVADAPVEAFAPWYFPAGEWLGAMYLRAGDPVSAEAAYRADLARTPNDARDLFGLSEALAEQGRLDESRVLAPQIVANWHGPASDLRDPEI